MQSTTVSRHTLPQVWEGTQASPRCTTTLASSLWSPMSKSARPQPNKQSSGSRNGGLKRRVQGEWFDLNQNPLDICFPWPAFYQLFTRGCEHDPVDSLSIPVVTDDPALIVDAVKIRVPRSGCIQLLPGFGLSVQGLGEEKIVRIPEFIEVSDHVIL